MESVARLTSRLELRDGGNVDSCRMLRMVACWIEKICGLRVVVVWAHAPAALLAAEAVVVGNGDGGVEYTSALYLVLR